MTQRPRLLPADYPTLPDSFVRQMNDVVSAIPDKAPALKQVTVEVGKQRPVKVRNPLGSAMPVAVWLGRARLKGLKLDNVALGNPSWSADGETLLIHDIYGSSPDQSYIVSLVVMGA